MLIIKVVEEILMKLLWNVLFIENIAESMEKKNLLKIIYIYKF